MPFVKLDKGIFTSTIWGLRPDLEIFVTALLLAEPAEYPEPTPTIAIGSLEDGGYVVPAGWYGFVAGSAPGIVAMAHVDGATGIEALKRLASPEPDSRSQEFEGRRMVRVNGGFIVLNYMKYRDFDHSAAERMRRLRERRKTNVTRNGVTVRPNVTHSREQKAESRKEDADKAPVAPCDDAASIYALYPRKVGKQAALRAIRGAMKAKATPYLINRVSAYAEAVRRWPAVDHQFIPHPSTWFNEGRYDDDPAEWSRNGNGATPPSPYAGAF